MVCFKSKRSHIITVKLYSNDLISLKVKYMMKFNLFIHLNNISLTSVTRFEKHVCLHHP